MNTQKKLSMEDIDFKELSKECKRHDYEILKGIGRGISIHESGELYKKRINEEVEQVIRNRWDAKKSAIKIAKHFGKSVIVKEFFI